MNEQEETLKLSSYAERAYLEYAMSVVKGRALPDVADGQKPVQRRILYAMRDMGLTAGAKPVKSARVVGEILGKYHPHGDSSAYEAMVRMAQDFSLRYPLIDGTGNFGSRDGDGAAAMRYTEARLTPISELLLSEINMGTVDFVPNYDGAFEEPLLLPARLPFVLLNGASGIAVGMATEIPSHNLSEIADLAIEMVRRPKLDIAGALDIMKGPDFHGGGQVINSNDEIKSIYETGKGSFRVRSVWEIENLARGQWRIVVTKIPPNTSCQKILTQIEELTNPKVKPGKKTLNQEQINNKALVLSYLEKVRDESDGENPVRIILEPRSSKIDPDEMMNALMVQTDLEMTVPVNLVMIGLDGKPRQKNLLEIMSEWIEYRLATITRRLEYRREYLQKRIHILEGRKIAYVHIDEVIKVIRGSDDPKAELMEKFNLTDAQAQDILEIRLRQLARLEWLKLQGELEELQKELEGILAHLADDSLKKQLMIKEIKQDKKTYGDERRTLIKEGEKAVMQQHTVDEPLTIILSKKGWIRARSGHELDLSNIGYKEGDEELAIVECRSVSDLVLLDSKGRSYQIDPGSVPKGRGEGIPISSMIEVAPGAHITSMLAGEPDDKFLMSSTEGYGFVVEFKDLLTRIKAGKQIVTLGDDSVCHPPIPLGKDFAGKIIALATDAHKLMAFPMDDMKVMGRGKGLQLISLDDGRIMKVIAVLEPDAQSLFVRYDMGGGQSEEHEIQLANIMMKRARKGKHLPSMGSIVAIHDKPADIQ